MKRRFKDNSGKRRGPYSLQNEKRVVKKPEEHEDTSELRKRISKGVRAGIHHVEPDFSKLPEGAGPSIILGVIHVAAEIISVGSRDERLASLESAIFYLKNQVALEVQATHARAEGAVTASEVGLKDETFKRVGIGYKEGFESEYRDLELDFAVKNDTSEDRRVYKQLAPFFDRYYAELTETMARIYTPDAARGAVFMLIYALNECMSNVVAAAPDAYRDKLVDEIVEMFRSRVTTKKERDSAHQPPAADRQLQADPLEAVPTEDHPRL